VQCRVALSTFCPVALDAVVELMFDTDKVAVGLLMLLLFSTSKAAEATWRHVSNDATLGGRITDSQLLMSMERLVDEEAQLSRSTIAFMQNLVPAVPVLLLGFLCLEGEELVTHELSVPGVKVMVSACMAYAVATVSQLLLDEKLDRPSSKLAVRAAALIGAVLLFAFEFHAGMMSLLLTLVSVAASLLVIQRSAASEQGYKAPGMAGETRNTGIA